MIRSRTPMNCARMFALFNEPREKGSQNNGDWQSQFIHPTKRMSENVEPKKAETDHWDKQNRVWSRHPLLHLDGRSRVLQKCVKSKQLLRSRLNVVLCSPGEVHDDSGWGIGGLPHSWRQQEIKLPIQAVAARSWASSWTILKGRRPELLWADKVNLNLL